MDELMTQGQAIATTVSGLAGAVLSLAFYLIPPLRRKYDGLSADWKPAVMGIMCAAVVVVLGILNWTDVWQLVPKDVYGVMTLLLAWFVSITSNQATYQMFVRSRANRS